MKMFYILTLSFFLFAPGNIIGQQMDIFLVEEPSENTPQDERIYRFSVRPNADTLIEYYDEPGYDDTLKPRSGAIDDRAYDSGFFVYPNPFDNILYVTVEDLRMEDFWVIIYNIRGEQFIAEDLTINKSRLEFDTSELPNEQYFLAIGTDEKDFRFSVRKY